MGPLYHLLQSSGNTATEWAINNIKTEGQRGTLQNSVFWTGESCYTQECPVAVSAGHHLPSVEIKGMQHHIQLLLYGGVGEGGTEMTQQVKVLVTKPGDLICSQ